jgi:hypothetical protein
MVLPCSHPIVKLFLLTSLIFAVKADFNVSVISPSTAPGAFADRALHVVATVSSTYEISAVHAAVGARETELTFSTQAYYRFTSLLPGWIGDLDLTDLPRGNQQISITVVDVFSNSYVTNVNFVLDGKPKLKITQPAEASVARPTLPMDVSCSDDAGGCSVSLVVNSTPIPFGSTADLSAFDHSVVTLEFRASDSAGQMVTEQRTVYVESNPRLIHDDSAPGKILDVSADRLLYAPTNQAVAILNRNSREQTLLASEMADRGLLTPSGAVYTHGPGSFLTTEVIEYPGGASLGSVNLASLKVKGPYVSWNSGLGGFYWKNTLTGARGQILGAANTDDDISEGGVVAYWTSGTYQVYLDGKLLSSGSGRNIFPITDGTITVWSKNDMITGSDGISEFVLSKAHPELSLRPKRNYQLAGGWVGYTDIGNTGQTEVWLREPSGNRRKVSFLGTDSWIDQLTPHGDVLFSNKKTVWLNTRYLNNLDLGSFIGDPYYINDQWHVAVGSELFRLNTDPGAAKANFNVVPISPRPVLGTFGDRALHVVTTISSTYEIASARAAVGTHETELTFSSEAYNSHGTLLPGWIGDLDLTDLPRGNQQLSITVVDVFSNSYVTNINFVLDGRPKLKITQPAEPSVARPTLPVEVSCLDDDAGCTVSLFVDGTPISFETTADLSAFDHSIVTLEFRAKDSAGQGVVEQRTVYVESNPRLVHEDSAPGKILDVSADRLLYAPTNQSLAILNRNSRAQTVIASEFADRGFLTPAGAAYIRQPGNTLTAELIEYPGGSSLGSASPTSLKVKGPYATWTAGLAGFYWKNTLTGARGQISDAVNDYNDISESGAVAYSTSGSYQVYLDGKQLSTGPQRNFYPITDGTITVWAKEDSIAGSDGVTEFLLSKAHPQFSLTPGRNYQLAGGWLAYTDIGNVGQTEIWLREPSGNRKKISFLGTKSWIDRLSPHGDVLFSNEKTARFNTRYLNNLDLGNFIGDPYFINEQWYVAVGPELFRLNTDAVTAPRRVISVTGTLDFGDAVVGFSKGAQMSIANLGTAPLTVTSISYPPGFSGDWSGGTLPANASQTVSVTFLPTATANYGGNVGIASDATEGAGTVAISGRGVAQSIQTILLSGNLAFGEVPVETAKSATLTISNTGNNPLQVQSINVPESFSVDWSSGAISPGASQNVSVTFLPLNNITYGGSLTVISDATAGVSTIPVSGIGRISGSPKITLTGILSFGSITVGTSVSAIFRISNTGEQPLTISQVNYPPGFAGDWPGGVIPAGGSHHVTVAFTPIAARSYSGTLTVLSDASNDGNTLPVQGVGIPAPSRILKLGGNLAFGSVPVGSSKTNLLVLSNDGNSPLTILGISFPTGLSGNWAGGEIPSGSTREIAVVFSPVAATSYNGNVIVSSDATAGNGVFAVFALGTQPPVLEFVTSDLEKPSDERFHLQIRGEAGKTVVLEASLDLKNWTEVARLQSILGQVDFSDVITNSNGLRFYRFHLE